MPEQSIDAQIQILLSDFNTRLKDAEERNRSIRERVLLLGKNLIFSKEESDREISELKSQVNSMQKDIKKLNSLAKEIVNELNSFVKRDETAVIERMLKDFQPLEFIREKDVEEIIDRKLGLKNAEQREIQKRKVIKRGDTLK